MDVVIDEAGVWPRTPLAPLPPLPGARRPFVLAIDPGSARSAYVAINRLHGGIVAHGILPNEQLLEDLRDDTLAREAGGTTGTTVVIEFMAPRGMPTSAQEMETLWWAGRFTEAAHPVPVERLTRDAVKLHLCGRRSKVTDTNVRAALIDRYGGIGGKEEAIGRKASPGPLYGIGADEWAALAVAVTWTDQEGDR